MSTSYRLGHGLSLVARLSWILISGCAVTSSALAFDLKNATKHESNNKAPSRNNELQSPTVRINTAASGGSGVIIGSIGNRYTVSTAFHVVDQSAISEISISIGTKEVPIKSITKPFPDMDWAVITFQYNESLPVAVLPFLDAEYWEEVKEWQSITVEGFANPSDAVQAVTLRKALGQITAIALNNKDGYDLVHTATTNVGMSGGGIYGQHYQTINALIVDPLAKEKIYTYKIPPTILDSQPGLGTTEAERRYVKAVQDSGKGWDAYVTLWKESDHTELQNLAFQICLNPNNYRNSSDPKIRLLQASHGKDFTKAGYRGDGVNQDLRKSDCSTIAHRVEELRLCESRFQPQHSLLGIHGKAEAYAYGGKSGAGLGVFLGSGKVKQWLSTQAPKLGINNGLPVARYHCKNLLDKRREFETKYMN